MTRYEHRAARRQDLEHRKGDVKEKARYSDVVPALNLSFDMGDECPFCHGLTLMPCADGKWFFCDACKRKGDMIDLVCEAERCAMPRAVQFMETIITSRRDARTRDLFGQNGKEGGA
ncbi:hypothetical protein PUV54_00185 [Hyphococcus flavus]|uniref:Uncharacterized protein n=1 Tax=Hyphococcus flavus TaxID=1866326 RepID=A0AAE9ZII7_9PROT|nr:hypothetical protein [Hyphococcus flavus]WDI31611.1 hypothetical protein PUV54_00185 [Hyphococcus flavus]